MKKVYQLIYNTFDDKFDRMPFYNFIENYLNGIHIFSNVYWIETELTPTELSKMIYPLMCHKERFADTWYIMELSTNMDCYMGTSYIEWLKERLDFNKDKN